MANFNPIILWIDDQQQQLVSWNGSSAAWPELFQGDVRDIQIGVLIPTGNQAGTAYGVANLNGYSMYLTITATPKGDGSQTVYAGPVALAWNAALNAFTGTLNLQSANIATAMGTGAQITATVGVNISQAGNPQGLYQSTLAIFAPANAQATVAPQPANQYLTSIQTEAEFVPRGGGQAGQGRIEISPSGFKWFISRNDDGTESRQRVA